MKEFSLTCEGNDEIAMCDAGAGINSLKQAKRLGWVNLEKFVEGCAAVIPNNFWTHIGKCPECQGQMELMA